MIKINQHIDTLEHIALSIKLYVLLCLCVKS